jgi:DNA-binding HxlR family transcriptional regulator
MKSRASQESICPADVVISVVMGRWASQVTKRIGEQAWINFGALSRALPGISHKVLTEQLRKLQQAGLIRRERQSTARREVRYSLTPRGRELTAALDGLAELAARWREEDERNVKSP